MNPLIDNALLVTDLDCDGFKILNPGDFDPPPSNAVGTDDPRLTDARNIINGSVTNESVHSNAGIVQSKLDLNGNIPAAWLGTGANQAAQGNLVQLLSLKGAANGYAPLDANGRIDAGDLPSTGPGAGTVNSVKLSLPFAEFNVTVGEVTTIGDLTAVWKTQANNSWYGCHGPIGLNPLANVASFLTKQIPVELVPDTLPGSIFTSGLFPVSMLPLVKGLGVNHAIGILPDPNPAKNEPATPSDYFGRDAKWKPMQIAVAYQPTLPNVQIVLQSYFNGNANIVLSCPTKDSLIFFLIAPTFSSSSFAETPNSSVKLVEPGNIIHAYAAKQGYNNSGITSFTVPPVPN